MTTTSSFLEAAEQDVRLIPLDHIHVMNPRSRGRNKFEQIASNIANIGLKKPIIVTPRPNPLPRPRPGDGEANDGEPPLYDLVCGQGRYEAYKLHGQTEIPAIVVDVTREQALLKSLVENLARRRRTSIEMARELAGMHARGHKTADIARKVGLDPGYVRGMLRLLDNGEERLLVAVENRRLPMSLAIQIADSDDGELQKVMAELYESKQLRGPALLAARRLIEKRRQGGKRIHAGRPQRMRDAKVSGEELLRAFREESDRQEVVIERARVCETRLRFIVTAMQQLLADEAVVNLLRAEGLDAVPRYLTDQLAKEAPNHGS